MRTVSYRANLRPASAEGARRLVITPGKVEANYWRDLWRFRDLFLFLAWRDILVRYKQTVVGIAWAVIRPLLTMLVFTVIFGRLAKMPSGGMPYPMLVMAGMLPWQFFANAIGGSSFSLVENEKLISKIYFPRIIVPVSSTLVSVVDLLVSFVLLFGLYGWYHVAPTWRLCWLPCFSLLAILAAVGPGVLISALNVEYRDFRYVIPFIVQFGLYVSPVGFTSAVVPAQWRLVYSLNPMVGIIEAFRWAICGTAAFDWQEFALSWTVTLAALVVGISYFRRTERMFADLI